MLTTAVSNIEGRLTSNRKMNVGMQMMRLLREEGLLEASTGIFPAICGGAVRDCLFTGNEINDIDIFFFRDSRSPTYDRNSASTQAVATILMNFRQDVLAWLEDQEIECESLLSTRAADYFGGQRFIDIIQFVWQDTTIQLMIPQANQLNSSIDYLLRTMPIYSGMALTMEYLRIFDTTMAHMKLPRGSYFVATDRDVPYLSNKLEGAVDVRFIPVSSSREAVAIALHNYYVAEPALPVRSGPNSQAVTDAWLMSNSTSYMAQRAFSDHFGLPADVVLTGDRSIHTQ